MMESPVSTKCSYIGCRRTWKSGQRFHYLPVHNAGLCVKWLINSGREDLLTHTSTILKSMQLVICSKHFHQEDYKKGGVLKDNSIPVQYWDTGYSHEPGEIREADVLEQIPNAAEDTYSSEDSDDAESVFEDDTDDEFRTKLGNKIEILLNSVMYGRSKNQKKTDLEKSLKNFYENLNIRNDGCKSKLDSAAPINLSAFKKATRGMCRTCAAKKSNLIKMTDKPVQANIDILTKLKLLIEIKEPDVLPTEICDECIVKLNQSYEFFQQIYKADNVLRSMLFDQSSKKTECDDNTRPAANCSTENIGVEETISKTNNVTLEKDENNKYYNSENGQMPNNDRNGMDEETAMSSKNIEGTENTVSYLLSESCSNDAELNWLDVVGAMQKETKKDKPQSPQACGTDSDLPISTFQVSCKYCNSSFRLRRQLKSHLLIHHRQSTTDSTQLCEIYTESKKKSTEDHYQVDCKQKYSCNDCNATFTKKAMLRLHFAERHATHVIHKPPIQEVCDTLHDAALVNKSTAMEVTPADNRSLVQAEKNNHILSHSDEIYTCDECKKTFTTKRILQNHIHRIHPPFAYTCSICNKVMYSEADTYKHMTLHDKSPLFPCLECGKMFYSTERLEKHMILHSENKLKKRKRVWFHCQLCDSSYQVSDELIKHIEGHSSEDWEKYRNKILYCGECNARLIGNEKFRIHKMRYHLAKRGDFICLLCDQVEGNFGSADEYEKHINLHRNELKRSVPRRYTCEHCDKAFKSNSHRLNHIDSFHSDVMHSCPICGVKVKRKGNLKDHIDRVHNSTKKQERINLCVTEEQFPIRKVFIHYQEDKPWRSS